MNQVSYNLNSKKNIGSLGCEILVSIKLAALELPSKRKFTYFIQQFWLDACVYRGYIYLGV